MVMVGGAIRAFDPVTSVGVLPDGRIILSDSTTWNLKVLGPDGELKRTWIRHFQPRAVTERDREAERNRRRAELDELAVPSVVVRRIRLNRR